jgi:hypothetical protein
MNEVDMTNDDSGLIWSGLMAVIDYSKAKKVSEEMTKVDKELNKVSIKEMAAFLNAIRPRYIDCET